VVGSMLRAFEGRRPIELAASLVRLKAWHPDDSHVGVNRVVNLAVMGGSCYTAVTLRQLRC